MTAKEWRLQPPITADVREFARSLGVTPLFASLLYARGLTTEEHARLYLEPKIEHLHDPAGLPDIGPAVERLSAAIEQQEPILVHGDYDADGVCAAALLTRVLRVLKADARCFVPHRQEHGYDLRRPTVEQAAADGVRLIITVDCGILAFEAADRAAELGVDLIVTDHHEPDPSGKLPQAVAVVNPHRPESDYPFAELCGTAVAFKVATALVQHLDLPLDSFQTRYLDLVALATVTDCVPLVGENRVFVRHGLAAMRRTKKEGLKALMRISKAEGSRLSARSLGFALGPRLNAVGRMGAAEHAAELLLTRDPQQARELADMLESANRERQGEQERLLEDALRQAQQFVEDRVLVLASPRWHPGVIGIVAAKLVESLGRPTMLIAIDEDAGVGRGSARGVHGYHLTEALEAGNAGDDPPLIRFGGHEGAAGFDIRPDRIDAFRAALQAHAEEHLSDELLEPFIPVDAILEPAALDLRLAREVASLEPFGTGNHEPIFVSEGVEVAEQRRLNARATGAPDHLKLRVRVGQNELADALFWREWRRADECPPDSRVDLCYSLEINDYGGRQRLQLNLKDLRPAE